MIVDTIIPLYRVIYSFPDKHTREQFCEGKYLELIGANEDFIDSDTDLHIEVRPGGQGVFKPPFTNPAPGANSVQRSITLAEEKS